MTNELNPDIPDDMTRDEWRELSASEGWGQETNVKLSEPVPWYQRILTPTFRRWAYGVSVAAVGVYAAVTKQPEIVPIAAPLILALFFVDSQGEPR